MFFVNVNDCAGRVTTAVVVENEMPFSIYSGPYDLIKVSRDSDRLLFNHCVDHWPSESDSGVGISLAYRLGAICP